MKIKQKKFVIADIHGNIKALKQCLERSNFNYDEDMLIVLGDLCDGYKYVKDCIDELLKIKDYVFVLGNHDKWALDWIETGYIEPNWNRQGGENTLKSYGYEKPPQAHIDFLNNYHGVYIVEKEDKRYIFVHGGLDWKKPLKEQKLHDIIWDRKLLHAAWMTHTKTKKPNHMYTDFDKVFLGHTTTQFYKTVEPMFVCNIVALDTGAGWDGKLTIMDIDTLEYFQSDWCHELYPDEKGRG